MGQRSSGQSRGAVSGAGAPSSPESALTLLAATVVCIAAVVNLWGQSAHGTFATDECFHATAATTILREHRLPATFPQFYSGFYYYYHPMFHVVGAAWAALLGLEALHVLPAALFAVLLAILLARPLGRGSAMPGAWAALLCVGNASLVRYAVRFYAESLVTLLVLAAVVLLLWFMRSPRRGIAAALGVVTGCALLSKFNAWMLLAPISAGAIVAQRRRRSDVARGLWVAAAIAVAMSAFHLVRNQVLYGSALYPAFAPDLDPGLYALNRARFSMPVGAFYAMLPRTFGVPLLAMVGAAIVAILIRRQLGWREALLGFGVLGTLIVPLAPYASERHVNPYIPVIALMSAAIVASALARRRWASPAVGIALVALAVIDLGHYGDLRKDIDVPPFLARAFREIRPLLPEDALVLSLWTYDTAYYTERRATWPIPWGQKDPPKEMLEESVPDRILSALRAHRIDYVLTQVWLQDRAFDSANYPASFVAGMDSLYRAGRVELTWGSPQVALLHVPRD